MGNAEPQLGSFAAALLHSNLTKSRGEPSVARMSSSPSSHQSTGLFTLIQKFANWRWDRLVEDVIVKCMQQVFPAGSTIEEVGNARRDQRPRQPGLGDGVSRDCDKASELGIVSHNVTHGNCCAPFVKFPVSARLGGDIN